MNYLERNKIETIYKDDYTDFTRLSDFEVFTKDILVSLKKLNILETKRKYERKYAFANAEQRDKPLAPLSLFITVDDTCNFLKKLVIKKDYCIKLNYIYYPHNKCQNVIPFNAEESSDSYRKNVNAVNSFYCLHGNLNCSEIVLFPARTFPIQRFFFVNEYVELEVIDRSVPEEEQYIVVESLSVSNLMLNALKQALSELEICLPTFVAVDKNYYIYHGHFYTSDYTYFKCVHPYVTVHRRGSGAAVSGTATTPATALSTASTPASTPASSPASATAGGPEKANYVSLYKGTGFEVNYNSFKFFNYFKCFSYDQLVALFSLFIYLSNVRGKNIFKISVYIKNIYLIDKPQCSHVLGATDLRNRRFSGLKLLVRGKRGRVEKAVREGKAGRVVSSGRAAKPGGERKREKQTHRKSKQIYIFKNAHKRNAYDREVVPHMYMNHIYNYIKKKKFYGRRIFLCCFVKERSGFLGGRSDRGDRSETTPLGGRSDRSEAATPLDSRVHNSEANPLGWWVVRRTAEERSVALRNYLFSMKSDLFGKPSYYQGSDFKKVKLTDVLSDDGGVEDEEKEEEENDEEGDTNEKSLPDYSDSSLLFYPCPSVTQNSSYEQNSENVKCRKKSTFEEINRLYQNLRSHKNLPKSESNPFVSIYVLNFISNMESNILSGVTNVSGGMVFPQNEGVSHLSSGMATLIGGSSNLSGSPVHVSPHGNAPSNEQDRRKRKKRVVNVWKIRFINNDNYKGKNSFLLKNILRLYYNELLELKKKKTDSRNECKNECKQECKNECRHDCKQECRHDCTQECRHDCKQECRHDCKQECRHEGANDMMTSVQHYLMEFMPLKNKDWVRDRETSAYSCFNVEEDSTRYYVDKILNNMFSSNKRKVYEWPRGRGARGKLRPRRSAHNECFGTEEAQSSGGGYSNVGGGGYSNVGAGGNPNSGGSQSPVGGANHRVVGGNLFVSKVDGELFPQKGNRGYLSLYQNDAKEVHFVLKKGDNFPKRRANPVHARKGRRGRDPHAAAGARGKGAQRRGQARGESESGESVSSGNSGHNGESDRSNRSNRSNGSKRSKRSGENKLEQLVRDFLKIKERYFLCHREERITVLFFYLISHSSNIKTFYYIWNQFFDNIRNKYENNEYIFNDCMFLSYGPLNVYSYRCSILSQYIKALNISTQQFKINEMKNHMKLKKTLSIFCNDSDNPLGKDSSSNCGSLSNVNEKEPFVSISHSKSSNSLTTFFKKSTFEETVFYSCEMNDSSSVYNRKSSGVPPHEGGSPNMELEHISGSADSIARLAPEAHPLSGVSGGVSNDVSNDLSNGVSNDLRNTPSNNPSNNVGNPPGDARPESPSNEPGKPPKRSGSALPGTERGKASKKSSPVISNFFPYPLNNMELFITKNNAGAKEVNDQDDMITLIHEILRSSNKDSYTYADFTRWYRNNVGKFSYTSQNVLKYCYKSIKDSYFVNVDVGYIKEKCKEIDEKYYRRGGTNDSCGKKGKEDYLKKMFHYVKSNYDYIKKIKCPFNTFFVGELNLDNLLNLNILDLLDCAFKVFFISYLNSVMNSKLIYIRKIQEVLASMFAIIKGIHRRGRGRRRSSRSRSSRKGERSGPGGERSGQNGEKNSRGGEESGQSGKKNSRGGDGNLGEATPPGCPNPSPALAKGARGKDPPGDDAGRRDPNSTVNLQDAAGDDSHPNVKGDHLAQERKSTAEKSSSVLRRETHGGSITPQGDTNRSSEGRRYYRVGAPNRDSTNHAAAIPSSGNPPHVKSQENVNDSERNSSDNVDFCYGGEQKTGYKNSFNINKEENYFKNFSVDSEKKKKKNTYNDANFSREIKRTYKKRYQIIFNQKLFLLFETCEQMFNKAAWLYRIFNNSLNEKRIFNLINTILESEEKEIVINPKDQKYFYDFIKNICLSENSKNGAFGKSGPFGKSGALDKKWSGASGSKFHRINKSISSRHLNRTFKSKRERSERSEIGERGERSEIGEKGERSEKNDNSAGSAKNPVINNPYQNLGVSVKVKKNDSQPCPSASDEKNMLNKDKLSLLLHSHNKEQNIQECIIDYVDHSFGDPLYNPPVRMYCSVNPVDTTVSFVKTTPIL